MKKIPYPKAILTGILIGTSYIPFVPWAYLFCFVPLWHFWMQLARATCADFNTTNAQTAKADHLNQTNSTSQAARSTIANPAAKMARTIFISGWLAQFTLTLIGFNWVALTAHEFGFLPWPIAILTLLLFAGFANIYIALAGVTWFYFQKKFHLSHMASAILLAALTALFESWVPTIFPWNFGYAWFWLDWPIYQNAELIGFQGLSSIIIMLNALSLMAFFKISDKRHKFAAAMATTTLLIFLTLNFSGSFLKNRLVQTDKELSTLIVQANIGNLQKQYAEKGRMFREFIRDKYTSLSREAHQKLTSNQIDFIVWPETAYPYDLDQRDWSNPSAQKYTYHAKYLIDLARELNSTLLTGGYGYAPTDGKLTNTFFVVNQREILPSPYYKTILLAFGEYIPGAKYLPEFITNLIPAGDFSRGPGPQAVAINNPNIKIGPQICYESLFPMFSKGLADQGAEVIVNLTNDSWYGTWQEPFQHNHMTLARAIEFRRPVIRATNTGISTVVLASGEILEQSPLASEWTGHYKIPYVSTPSPTFYQQYPWLIESLLIITVFMIILIHRKQK